jgi:hypothetical protein
MGQLVDRCINSKLGSVHKWCPIWGGEGGSTMTPKNRIIEVKNRIKGGRGGKKWLKKIGHHLCMIPYSKICTLGTCLWSKMPKFQRVEMSEGGGPLRVAFQYLILMIWRPCDLNLVMISSVASKCKHFKLRGLQFHFIKWLKNGHPNFKVLAFWSH